MGVQLTHDSGAPTSDQVVLAVDIMLQLTSCMDLHHLTTSQLLLTDARYVRTPGQLINLSVGLEILQQSHS
jgi:hypothetical protein